MTPEEFVGKRCDAHFMPLKGVWTCCGTLGIDINAFGVTEKDARENLANRIKDSAELSSTLKKLYT